MSAPGLQIHLKKIHHNARVLVALLAARGISVTGVTKATLGSPKIARTLLAAGVSGLGDSRIENLEAFRRAGVLAAMTLLRSPMLSQVERVVHSADVSFNTEPCVLEALSIAAGKAGRGHGIVLMVELGDLREGILPDDLEEIVGLTLRLPNLDLRGIGTNLACRSGVSPDAKNMSELSALATSLEAKFDLSFDIVSGGNSANLAWALDSLDLGSVTSGRINNLRLGEAILLGREPLHRRAIDSLHTDAITLVAEVIESKIKPSQPWGEIAQNAFADEAAPPVANRGDLRQSILGIGRQDIDPSGLHAPRGVEILGASSDHLVVSSPDLRVGDEVTFLLGYSALLRAMTSPFVVQNVLA